MKADDDSIKTEEDSMRFDDTEIKGGGYNFCGRNVASGVNSTTAQTSRSNSENFKDIDDKYGKMAIG